MSVAVDRLVWVVAQLREHCPWTRRLTHAVLTEYLIEEAYEAVEVIESAPPARWPEGALADGTYEKLRLEMGDVLFQVVLHAAIAQGAGGFTFDGTAEAITAKMIRRNPHVFHADGSLREPQDLAAARLEDIEKNWERIKKAERASETAEKAGTAGTAEADAGKPGEVPDADLSPGAVASPVTSPVAFAEVPAHLPALAAAAKVVDRAARQPVDPLPEPGPPPSGQDPRVQQDEGELGAELFRLVQRSRAAGLDPERALRQHLAALRHDLSGTDPTG
ncbi:MazG nucleotide pyrophosphohydrolase domain-containing protein [Citricoccus muralis]|uniref:XTP/dITP diphosphohydrolase n=1 Tax=Citricoccus muralis TaxID=169134 RepID=A0A3D9LJN1_9MICC|nr:MazG nucleotide pyrophosphohydrolase domain-containing protein [Citricoccus muralis]REE05253.1 XTP/dITP diphosphohydrolase [Citricoccus muralis]